MYSAGNSILYLKQSIAIMLNGCVISLLIEFFCSPYFTEQLLQIILR